MTEFPALVYKAKGKHIRPYGTYDYVGVNNAEELAEKLSEGWFESLEAAIEALKPKKFAETPVSKPAEPVSSLVVDDSAAPTRQELETKANELGIKFDGRYSDKRLTQLIDDALAK